jgi:hypothetical protein
LAAFSAFPQNIKGVYQFLYRSTDALGIATATVTTLMVPVNADPSKLVSYQTAEGIFSPHVFHILCKLKLMLLYFIY